MATWTKQTKNTSTWNTEPKEGAATFYDDVDFSYNMSSLFYNSLYTITSWLSQTKNNSTFTNQTKN